MCKRVRREGYLLVVTCFPCPLCIHLGCWICASQEAYKQRFAPNFLQSFVDFVEQEFGDIVRQYDFTVGFFVSHRARSYRSSSFW